LDIRQQANIADRIAEDLVDRILSDNFDIGEFLPSERNLMQEFGVSRLVCREALAKLRGMGIIKTRHGKGAFLADVKEAAVNPATLRILKAHGNISNTDVLQARLIIEPEAAGLAASHRNRTQSEQIYRQAEQAVGEYANLPLVERTQRCAEADVLFHQAIAAASGNPLLPMLLKSMHELLLRVRLEVLILKPDIVSRALADHLKIAMAIRDGDSEGAKRAMERHIRLRGEELLKE